MAKTMPSSPWRAAMPLALLALIACSSAAHSVAAQGIPIRLHESTLQAASNGDEPEQLLDLRRVDYHSRQPLDNSIEYCSNTFCGPCAQLPADPCKVVDGFGSNTSVCMLPDMLGGVLPTSSLCGVGASAVIPPPDSLSSTPAAQVYVFRNASGVLFISIVMSCNWLMVADAGSDQGLTGVVSYSIRSVEFVQDFNVPMPNTKQRFSCFTAVVPLPGLSSVCQNLDASVQVSFHVQRFGALSPQTCRELSAPTRVDVTVALTKYLEEPIKLGMLGVQVGSSSSTDDATIATSDANLLPNAPIPAVLAMLQLQLDLSGSAAMAWMDNLTATGPSSDVNVLGHDIGALIVLPDAYGPSVAAGGGPEQATCADASVGAMARVVAALEEALRQYGGAVRAWQCMAVQAAQATLPAGKLPWCIAAGQPANGASLLALALRLPPGTTTASILRVIARSVPSAGCVSSEAQLDVCTDVQLRILGTIPPTTAYSSMSVSETNLRAAALQVAPLLLPPRGAPVPISMMPSSSKSFAILTAAGRMESGDAAGSGSSASDTRPCVACPACSGSGSMPAWVLPTLAACCGAMLLIIIALASTVVAMARRHKRLQGSGDGSPGKGGVVAGAAGAGTALGAPRSYEAQHGAGSGRFSLGKKRTAPQVMAWNTNTLFDLDERALSHTSMGSVARGQGRQQPGTPPHVSGLVVQGQDQGRGMLVGVGEGTSATAAAGVAGAGMATASMLLRSNGSMSSGRPGGVPSMDSPGSPSVSEHPQDPEAPVATLMMMPPQAAHACAPAASDQLPHPEKLPQAAQPEELVLQMQDAPVAYSLNPFMHAIADDGDSARSQSGVLSSQLSSRSASSGVVASASLTLQNPDCAAEAQFECRGPGEGRLEP